MTLRGRAAIAVLVALGLSLIVNFGLAGFMAARNWHDRGRPAVAERLASLGPRALPQALRSDVAARLTPQAPELRAAIKAARDARQAVFATMRAEPYDRATVAAALATLREKLDAVSTIGETAILDTLDGAPADARAAIGQPGKIRGGN